jgi:hypothetical protein
MELKCDHLQLKIIIIINSLYFFQISVLLLYDVRDAINIHIHLH